LVKDKKLSYFDADIDNEVITHYTKLIHDFKMHKKVHIGKYFGNVHYKALSCDYALQFDDEDKNFIQIMRSSEIDQELVGFIEQTMYINHE
jgi:hypothetical protein